MNFFFQFLETLGNITLIEVTFFKIFKILAIDVYFNVFIMCQITLGGNIEKYNKKLEDIQLAQSQGG